VLELADIVQAARERKTDFAAETVLRRYERRRCSDNVISARAFDALQRGFGSDNAALAAVRGAGLSLVDRVAPLKRFFARRAAGGIRTGARA
jgi:2-polyprenyl-6-methoxyphenol hydroxylase-like FAD-dependent oxidoreductase